MAQESDLEARLATLESTLNQLTRASRETCQATEEDQSQDVPVYGELRSGPIAGSTFISAATFEGLPVYYANVNSEAIFEGDIVLGQIGPEGDEPEQGLGRTGDDFRWPDAQVPYEIDPGLLNQQRIAQAIAHWETNTPIRFILRTAANALQYPDYVRFTAGGGCSSMVGRQGGQQLITLGAGCTSGNAIHEIGHTVGLWHEQGRSDRDQYIRIMWANIDPAMQHNFTQHVSDGDDLGRYDFGSIMHYPRDAFSVNGQDTIVPIRAIPAGVVIGQRQALSAGDIAAVNAMYPLADRIVQSGSASGGALPDTGTGYGNVDLSQSTLQLATEVQQLGEVMTRAINKLITASRSSLAGQQAPRS